eukprot:g14681.t1
MELSLLRGGGLFFLFAPRQHKTMKQGLPKKSFFVFVDFHAHRREEPHKSQPGRDHVDHVDEDPARGDEQEQVVLPRGKRDCSGKDKIWTVHYMPWAVPQCVDYDHWCQGTSWYKPKIDAVCKAEGEEVLLRNDADKNRLCQDSAAGGLEKGLAGLYRIPTKCGPCDGKKESCFIAGGGGKEGEEKLKGSTPYHIEAQMQLIYDSCYARGASHITRTSWNGAVEFVISVLEKMKERGDVLRFAIVIDPNATRGQHWTQAHDPAQSPFTTRWVGHELYHTWKGKKLVPVFAVNLATAPVKMGRNYEALDTGGVHFAGTYPWPCGGNGGNLQYLRDRYRECREGKRTDMPCVGLLYPQFCDCYKDTSYCCHGYCEIPGKMTENCLFATASFLAGELKGEASGVDIVQIVTWNDYGEMTHIEPSTLRGLDEKLPGCAGGGLLPNVCLSQRKFPQGYKDWRGMVEGRLGQNKESNAAQTLLREVLAQKTQLMLREADLGNVKTNLVHSNGGKSNTKHLIHSGNLVFLTRVGDFYEVWGYDAVLAVQYGNLNAMGGKPRAGCPRGNVQQLLDSLCREGLKVAVYEEGSSVPSVHAEEPREVDVDKFVEPRGPRNANGNPKNHRSSLKKRFLAQIVTAAQPTYEFGMDATGRPTRSQLPPRPVVVLVVNRRSNNASSYEYCELFLEQRQLRRLGGLTRASVRAQFDRCQGTSGGAAALVCFDGPAKIASSKHTSGAAPPLGCTGGSAEVPPPEAESDGLLDFLLPYADAAKLTRAPGGGFVVVEANSSEADADRFSGEFHHIARALRLLQIDADIATFTETTATKWSKKDDIPTTTSTLTCQPPARAPRAKLAPLGAGVARFLGLTHSTNFGKDLFQNKSASSISFEAGSPRLAEHLLPKNSPAAAYRWAQDWLLLPPPPQLRDDFVRVVSEFRRNTIEPLHAAEDAFSGLQLAAALAEMKTSAVGQQFGSLRKTLTGFRHLLDRFGAVRRQILSLAAYQSGEANLNSTQISVDRSQLFLARERLKQLVEKRAWKTVFKRGVRSLRDFAPEDASAATLVDDALYVVVQKSNKLPARTRSRANANYANKVDEADDVLDRDEKQDDAHDQLHKAYEVDLGRLLRFGHRPDELVGLEERYFAALRGCERECIARVTEVHTLLTKPENARLLQFAAHALVAASVASLHAEESLRRNWHLPTSSAEESETESQHWRIELKGLRPYWTTLPVGSGCTTTAQTNDIVLSNFTAKTLENGTSAETTGVRRASEKSSLVHVHKASEVENCNVDEGGPDGPHPLQHISSKLVLLTAPNASGKSCLLRSLLATILLHACGFYCPVAQHSSVQNVSFDSLLAFHPTGDCVLENKSAFENEVSHMAELLEVVDQDQQDHQDQEITSSCGRRGRGGSFLVIDEFGRGTSAQEASCLATALLEWLAATAEKRKKPVCAIFATHLHEMYGLLDDDLLLHKDHLHLDYWKMAADYSYRVEPGRCHDSEALRACRGHHGKGGTSLPLSLTTRAEALLKERLDSVREVLRRTLGAVQDWGGSRHESCSPAPVAIVDLMPKQKPPALLSAGCCVYVLEIPPSTRPGPCSSTTSNDPGPAYCSYYVGETTSLRQRLTYHGRTKKWGRALIAPVGDRSAAQWIETSLIQELTAQNFPMFSKADGRRRALVVPGSAGGRTTRRDPAGSGGNNNRSLYSV